jgi:hypothetical protein
LFAAGEKGTRGDEIFDRIVGRTRHNLDNLHRIKSSRQMNDLSAGLRIHFRVPSFRARLRDKRGGVFAIALP